MSPEAVAGNSVVLLKNESGKNTFKNCALCDLWGHKLFLQRVHKFYRQVWQAALSCEIKLRTRRHKHATLLSIPENATAVSDEKRDKSIETQFLHIVTG